MRSALLLVAATALLLASCDDEKATTPTDSVPMHRDIPASLRAKCPDMTAARAVVDGEVMARTASVAHIAVYDSTGAFVSKSQQTLNTTSGTGYGTGSTYVGWNGRDAAGNKVPTGVYFVFTDIYDDAGNLQSSRSDCIGVRSST